MKLHREINKLADKHLGDKIPEFGKKKPAGAPGSSMTSGPGIDSFFEVLSIVLVAVFIVGGAEIFVRYYEVPSYVMPPPSAIITALFTDFEFIAPHLGYTLVELIAGYTVGASLGLLLAAVITQFPFAEKIVAPYILMLVTTPMLALVPLLILRFGFGYEPRIIAVALASGPMVMINSATGFRRTDLAKIALARSFGANTFQIFMKIRFPMAMPMIVVGLMIGAIFGLLTAVGAEMVGGGFGLGNRLTNYSATLQMPQFFAVILVLSALGILIYVIFFQIGKKWASWES
jgi:NitT/TauT family transport system permease protein